MHLSLLVDGLLEAIVQDQLIQVRDLTHAFFKLLLELVDGVVVRSLHRDLLLKDWLNGLDVVVLRLRLELLLASAAVEWRQSLPSAAGDLLFLLLGSRHELLFVYNTNFAASFSLQSRIIAA